MQERSEVFKDASSINFDDLPQSMQDLAEAVGMEIVAKILAKFSGKRLYIPDNIKIWHPIHACIGGEGSKKLQEIYGGETLTVPMATVMQRRIRNREIVRQYDAGARVSDLGDQYNITERHIYSILKEQW